MFQEEIKDNGRLLVGRAQHKVVAFDLLLAIRRILEEKNMMEGSTQFLLRLDVEGLWKLQIYRSLECCLKPCSKASKT